MPGTDMKRVNYFLGQFLEAQDFLDEQSYHVELRRRRNRLQYGPGILDGLAVTKTGARQITVGAGTAVDRDGRELVVLVPQVVPNVTGAAGSTVFVTITYAEAQLPEDQRTKGGYTGYIRMAERPQIKVQAAPPPPASAGVDLVLASAQLDASSNITTVNTSVRQLASMTVSSVVVSKASGLSGALTVEGLLSAQGDAVIGPAGGANASLIVNGKIGVGVATPRAQLHVNGVGLVSDGDGYAVPNGRMAKGSLTIGSLTSSFGGGNGWTANTAGLLLETVANTEIAVHDSGQRVASIVYYEGEGTNRLTIGRDMGGAPFRASRFMEMSASGRQVRPRPWT